jgi:DNA-binding LacI/PurR family transcriptional regulator
MAKTAKTTITDVAHAAGVAVGTVSRVLNNHTDVNAGIRAKVWEAAQALNYTRIRQRGHRQPASTEQPTRATSIGVIFFGMEDTLVQLPVVSSALQGIEGALSARGHSLMLANIPRGDRLPPFLQSGQVSGLILKGPNQGELPPIDSSPLLQSLLKVPYVWLMGRLPNAKGDHCNFDTEVAGHLAVDHLKAKGHRRVAFLNPKPGQNQFEKLKASFLSNAQRAGLQTCVLETPRPEALEWPLPAITQENIVISLLERWSAMPAAQRPTALFVPSDRTAVQTYAAFSRMGLVAGRDLSVISCNNEHSLLMNLHPSVTTIDVHADTIGRRAVDQLLWRINNPAEDSCLQVLVEPSLVEGDSVATL